MTTLHEGKEVRLFDRPHFHGGATAVQDVTIRKIDGKRQLALVEAEDTDPFWVNLDRLERTQD